MESNPQINTAGSLNNNLANRDELKCENNTTEIAPSLSDFELQKIKEELGMLDSGSESDNSSLPLPSIYVDENSELTPFDFPLTEEERALLEQCTIGSPRRFSDSPSVCSASLEQLADSLIKDFEDMDSDVDVCFDHNVPEENTSEDHFTGMDHDLKTGSSPRFGKNQVTFDQPEERATSVPSNMTVEDNKNVKKSSEVSMNIFSRGNPVSPQINRDVDTGSSTASLSSKNSQLSDQTSRSLSLDSDSLPASFDSGLPIKDVQIFPQHNYFVVVAIDFGTTFSGYAFAFTRDPGSVHMMRRWEGGDPGVTNQKTPTTLLLKPDGSFHSFGFGARDFYHDLETEDAKKWMYFEKFKMSLHSDKVIL